MFDMLVVVRRLRGCFERDAGGCAVCVQLITDAVMS